MFLISGIINLFKKKPARCPYCKERQENFFTYHMHEDGDLFWCNHCGEMSLFYRNGKKLCKPSKKELDHIFENVDNERLNSVNWLPIIDRKNLHFDVVLLEGGIYNPNSDFSFIQAERLLKLMYHKIGYLPQVGDDIEGEKRVVVDNRKRFEDNRFIIVGRSIAVDYYDEIKLIVVSEKKWLEKQGW